MGQHAVKCVQLDLALSRIAAKALLRGELIQTLSHLSPTPLSSEEPLFVAGVQRLDGRGVGIQVSKQQVVLVDRPHQDDGLHVVAAQPASDGRV